MRKILIGLTVMFLCGADKKEDAIKKEMEQLQGQWSMVSGEIDKQPLPENYVKGATRVVKGDETNVTIAGDVWMKAKFTIDPTKKPKTIDYDVSDGPAKGKILLGIYELDGDTIKFCYASPGKDRPKDFATEKGAGLTLSTWKRIKK